MFKRVASFCIILFIITFIIENTNPYIAIKQINILKDEYNVIEKELNKLIEKIQIQKKNDFILKEYEAKRKAKQESNKQYKLSRSCDEVLLPHYNSNNLTELSNLTQEQIHTMLEGTRLQCLSAYYYEYEKIYKVNALFIISLTSLESGYGTSKLARTHNNLAGYRGSKSWTYFNSWHDCLNEVYRLIGQEYLSPDGRFYNGLDIKSINSKYCGNTYQWSIDINTIAHKYLKKLRDE